MPACTRVSVSRMSVRAARAGVDFAFAPCRRRRRTDRVEYEVIVEEAVVLRHEHGHHQVISVSGARDEMPAQVFRLWRCVLWLLRDGRRRRLCCRAAAQQFLPSRRCAAVHVRCAVPDVGLSMYPCSALRLAILRFLAPAKSRAKYFKTRGSTQLLHKLGVRLLIPRSGFWRR